MQSRNRRNGVHRLEGRSGQLVFVRRKTVLLKSPSLLRHELKRGFVIGGGVTVPNNGQLVANSPIPETRIMSSPKPWQAVQHTLAQQRDRSLFVHGEIEHAEAHRHLVFPMQCKKCVIHSKRITTGERVEFE